MNSAIVAGYFSIFFTPFKALWQFRGIASILGYLPSLGAMVTFSGLFVYTASRCCVLFYIRASQDYFTLEKTATWD